LNDQGFRLWITGKAHPGGRARFSGFDANGKVRFRPAATDKVLRRWVTLAWVKAGRPKLDGPYVALAHFEIPRFKTHYTKSGDLSAAGRRAVLPEGDWDNFGKLAVDSLVKIGAVDDDKLAAGGHVTKDWADGQDHPGTITIEVQPWNGWSGSMPAIAWAQI
jgi:hypothetical protein